MAQRRSYAEGCIAAHALDLVGDRWALLVVRELMLGPRRFGAIRAAIPGCATNMLARRLGDLEGAGLVVQQTLPPPASVPVYVLTPAGESLWPVLRELCRWGAVTPGHDPRLPISPTALMLSMRATCDTGRGIRAEAGFIMGEDAFRMTVSPGAITVARDPRPDAPLIFTGTANALAPVIYGPLPLAEAALLAPGWGATGFQGDPDAGQEFIDLFNLSRPGPEGGFA